MQRLLTDSKILSHVTVDVRPSNMCNFALKPAKRHYNRSQRAFHHPQCCWAHYVLSLASMITIYIRATLRQAVRQVKLGQCYPIVCVECLYRLMFAEAVSPEPQVVLWLLVLVRPISTRRQPGAILAWLLNGFWFWKLEKCPLHEPTRAICSEPSRTKSMKVSTMASADLVLVPGQTTGVPQELGGVATQNHRQASSNVSTTVSSASCLSGPR